MGLSGGPFHAASSASCYKCSVRFQDGTQRTELFLQRLVIGEVSPVATMDAPFIVRRAQGNIVSTPYMHAYHVYSAVGSTQSRDGFLFIPCEMGEDI